MILRASLVHNFKLKNYLCMSRTQWGGGEPGTAPAWPRVWNKRIHINNMNTRGHISATETNFLHKRRIFSSFWGVKGGWYIIAIATNLGPRFLCSKQEHRDKSQLYWSSWPIILTILRLKQIYSMFFFLLGHVGWVNQLWTTAHVQSAANAICCRVELLQLHRNKFLE